MRHRLALALGVVSVLAVALASASGAIGSPPGGLRHASATPDVTTLFSRAVKLVRNARRPDFTRALVYEADGSTQGGHAVISASGIVRWKFVFQNETPKSPYASATVAYGPPPRHFGRVVGYTAPFLEDVAIRRAPRLTLANAVVLLRRAGFHQRFVNVILRNPLGPKLLNPLYIFVLSNGKGVSVDTVTHKVVGSPPG